ncbi:MAG: aldo/keto reductase [Lachnospiraceae bacterium]|nr:aldo/keto reductase [Lachnospiraceae bacterium]
MIYRENPKNGDKLSILAFGCMRFSKDINEVKEQIAYAIDHGVNYFDTAYVYPNSETILGEALEGGYREKIKLATKLPPYMVKKQEDFDKIFNTQLKRLKTDYIDYYLVHMLTDTTVWNRLLDLGILSWIEEKKRIGQIKNIGFSYHGGKEEFIKLVDAYDWDFCQIQYNYLDENNQAGRSGFEYVSSKGIPVMIMEPLRGGKLVSNLPAQVQDIWENAYVKRSPAEWAFRWLWNQAGVTTVLSGMNSMDMLKENIDAASDLGGYDFSTEDITIYQKVKEILNSTIKIPCTGCNYCMPCPVGVDIPVCFSCYNDIEIEGKIGAKMKYIMQTTLKKNSANASMCKQCGKCEQHCPQKIKIRQELQNVSKSLEGVTYKPLRFLMKRFMKI